MRNQLATFLTINNLGYGPMLNSFEKKFGYESFDNKCDIPIGYARIKPNAYTAIYMNEDVKKFIQSIVEPCTNNKQTPREFPFFLLGKSSFGAEGIVINLTDVVINPQNENLQSEKADYSVEMINEMKKRLKDNMFNVTVIGHSHTRLTEEMREKGDDNTKAARKYIEEIREAEDLRESGLNPSMQDIFQLIAFSNNIRDTFRGTLPLSCIYHFNGEFNFMHFDDSDYEINLIKMVYYKLGNDDKENVLNYAANNENEKRR